jgi:hypothetical protein
MKQQQSTPNNSKINYKITAEIHKAITNFTEQKQNHCATSKLSNCIKGINQQPNAFRNETGRRHDCGGCDSGRSEWRR